MKIQRLSTSSFKFYSPEGRVVMIDPWLTNDPLWPTAERTSEKLKEIDVIAITHSHFDHSSGIDEIVAQNEKTFIIAPFEYALSLMGRGIRNIIPAGVGATIDLVGIRFSLVSAAHSNSQILPDGTMGVAGTAVGYVIEFENGQKIYASGDTGLTADMKFVVADYFKPDIAILPVIGLFMMEPEQAAYAAGITGCKHVIPSHDFPPDISTAANPDGYAEFAEQFPILETYKKTEKFMQIIKSKYPHIQGIYISIGGSADIG